ncbi:MAG: hypothetical protein DMF11_06830 [Verrucomicrobia bacterium]|nr:MAG: hypothetical protein DMF11_06830 [Verrucomicrobiota bacterium]
MAEHHAQVDRLVLKAMPIKSPQAQSSTPKAFGDRSQRVEDNAFHPVLSPPAATREAAESAEAATAEWILVSE